VVAMPAAVGGATLLARTALEREQHPTNALITP
jgi:hypothetical protein